MEYNETAIILQSNLLHLLLKSHSICGDVVSAACSNRVGLPTQRL